MSRGGKQRVRKLASDRRADLSDLLGAGSRSRRWISVALSVLGTGLARKRRLESRLGQLLDEMRHAVGLREDALLQFREKFSARP